MVGEIMVLTFLPWCWVRTWFGLFTLMMCENMIGTVYLDGGWEHSLDVFTLMVGENMVWMFLPWWWVRTWFGLFTLMMGENMIGTFYLDGGWEHSLDFLPLWWVRIWLGLFTLMAGENMVWTFYLYGGWEHGLDVFTLMAGENMVWMFLPWWWVRTWFGHCAVAEVGVAAFGWVSRFGYRSGWPSDRGTAGEGPFSSPMPRGGWTLQPQTSGGHCDPNRVL